MKTSEKGIALIKRHEGMRLKSYLCPANKLTIGFGHTSAAGQPLVKPDMTITKEQAHTILLSDLLKFEEGVKNLVKVPLSQGQFDALVSFAFNCGLGTPKGHRLGPSGLAGSTLLKRVNAGEYDKVPTEFMKWNKGGGRVLPGLVVRRREEVALWRGIDHDAPVVNDEARTTPDAPVPSKPITKSKEANVSAIAGSAAVITAISEGASRLKDGADILPVLTDSLGRPTVIVLLLVGMACAAVWYWRNQRLQEEGA